MKSKLSLLLLFCIITGKNIKAQVIDIAGTWTMFEMTWTSGEEVNKTTEEQLKDQGMTTDYFFMQDGAFKFISNMTGSGNMETVEGTWELERNKLSINLSMDDNDLQIIWDFEFKDDVINLTRTSPDGSTSVVNSFRRKLP